MSKFSDRRKYFLRQVFRSGNGLDDPHAVNDVREQTRDRGSNDRILVSDHFRRRHDGHALDEGDVFNDVIEGHVAVFAKELVCVAGFVDQVDHDLVKFRLHDPLQDDEELTDDHDRGPANLQIGHFQTLKFGL